MKISRDLPQFKNKKALLLVLGNHTADMYLAEKYTVNKLDEFSILTPKYSDRESFFMRTGHGMFLGSGSTYEAPKKEDVSKFIRTFKEHFKRVVKSQKPDEYYLYVPEFLHLAVKEVLGTESSKIIYSFHGNFIKSSPFELLGMIGQRRDEIYGAKVPVKEEARKILAL